MKGVANVCHMRLSSGWVISKPSCVRSVPTAYSPPSVGSGRRRVWTRCDKPYCCSPRPWGPLEMFSCRNPGGPLGAAESPFRLAGAFGDSVVCCGCCCWPGRGSPGGTGEDCDGCWACGIDDMMLEGFTLDSPGAPLSCGGEDPLRMFYNQTIQSVLCTLPESQSLALPRTTMGTARDASIKRESGILTFFSASLMCMTPCCCCCGIMVSICGNILLPIAPPRWLPNPSNPGALAASGGNSSIEDGGMFCACCCVLPPPPPTPMPPPIL